MSIPISFTASVDMPDGRHITVTIDIPSDHPALEDERDLLDHTEYAQMGAAHALRILRSGDHHRARRQAEEIDEMNRQIVAQLNGEAPF